MSQDRAFARAISDACLGLEAGEAMAGDFRAFLEQHGVAREDVEACADSARLFVYRDLVRNGLSSVVARMLPRTRRCMNAVCTGRFDADFAHFVDRVGPRTHCIRDVPAEFVLWASPQWSRDAAVPAYIADLAHYEIARFAVAASGSSDAFFAHEPSPGEIDLERGLVFAPSMRLLRFHWAVHEPFEDEEALGTPAERGVQLLAYRDADQTVRWLELTPLAAAIVEHLSRGAPLGVGIQSACVDLDATSDNREIALLLADLGERGVLLGGRTTDIPSPPRD